MSDRLTILVNNAELVPKLKQDLKWNYSQRTLATGMRHLKKFLEVSIIDFWYPSWSGAFVCVKQAWVYLCVSSILTIKSWKCRRRRLQTRDDRLNSQCRISQAKFLFRMHTNTASSRWICAAPMDRCTRVEEERAVTHLKLRLAKFKFWEWLQLPHPMSDLLEYVVCQLK